MAQGRLFGLPAGDAARVYGLAVTFGLVFIVAYGGASVLSALVPWRITVELPFEPDIPFVAAAALPYLSIIPFLAMAPFILRDLPRFLPMFMAATVATLVAALTFIVLPVEPGQAMSTPGNETSLAFRLADWLNLERNYLPSLHVALTLIATLAYRRQAGPFTGVLISLWATAIIASTLLTRQHFLVDVIAGVVLGAACWRTVGAWARRDDVLDAMDVELLCLDTFRRCTARHRRYGVIAVALYWYSLPAPRARRIVRTGFAFLQTVDDLLDGDLTTRDAPLLVSSAMARGLLDGSFGNDSLSRLARAFRVDLHEAGGREAIESAVQLIHTMQADHRRAMTREEWSARALRDQHRRTFSLSIDLLLTAMRSTVRSTDMPQLIDALGWCSTVRDLDEDIEHGLINIPGDVLEVARRDMPDRDLPALVYAAPVTAWLAAGAAETDQLLDTVDGQAAGLPCPKAAAVARLFSRSIRRYTREWRSRGAAAPMRLPAPGAAD